jgi:H+/Cl- antiporter ClcA
VEFRDEQPTQHEIGRRTYLVADVEPLDVDGVRTVLVGSIAWAVAFVALLPFYGELEESGRTWWLWTCLAGFGLGLFGYEYCRRRRRTRTEAAEAAPERT